MIDERTVEIVADDRATRIDRRAPCALAAPCAGAFRIEARDGARAVAHKSMMDLIGILVLTGLHVLLVDAIGVGRNAAGCIERRYCPVACADEAMEAAGTVLIKPGGHARTIDALGIGICRAANIEGRVNRAGAQR